MNFSGAGTVRDELGRSERIREYICFEHGYYHLGERKPLTRGLWEARPKK
jgi:hypothetical protein